MAVDAEFAKADEAYEANETNEADEADSADEAADATETTKADEADVAEDKPGNADKAKADEADEAIQVLQLAGELMTFVTEGHPAELPKYIHTDLTNTFGQLGNGTTGANVSTPVLVTSIAPAIAVGCPFVMKPASRTPLGAISIRHMSGVRETVHFPLPMGLGDKSMSALASSRS